MVTGCLLLSASFGLDYMATVEETDKGIGGLIIGFRAGYNIAISKDDWMLDDLELAGGPDIGFTGPFFRLLIGGGGFGPKK